MSKKWFKVVESPKLYLYLRPIIQNLPNMDDDPYSFQQQLTVNIML